VGLPGRRLVAPATIRGTGNTRHLCKIKTAGSRSILWRVACGHFGVDLGDTDLGDTAFLGPFSIASTPQGGSIGFLVAKVVAAEATSLPDGYAETTLQIRSPSARSTTKPRSETRAASSKSRRGPLGAHGGSWRLLPASRKGSLPEGSRSARSALQSYRWKPNRFCRCRFSAPAPFASISVISGQA